jgi:hypothetical protein
MMCILLALKYILFILLYTYTTIYINYVYFYRLFAIIDWTIDVTLRAVYGK